LAEVGGVGWRERRGGAGDGGEKFGFGKAEVDTVGTIESAAFGNVVGKKVPPATSAVLTYKHIGCAFPGCPFHPLPFDANVPADIRAYARQLLHHYKTIHPTDDLPFTV
jgi:hypothetical protein